MEYFTTRVETSKLKNQQMDIIMFRENEDEKIDKFMKMLEKIMNIILN